jgi:hypothetical protein
LYFLGIHFGFINGFFVDQSYDHYFELFVWDFLPYTIIKFFCGIVDSLRGHSDLSFHITYVSALGFKCLQASLFLEVSILHVLSVARTQSLGSVG